MPQHTLEDHDRFERNREAEKEHRSEQRELKEAVLRHLLHRHCQHAQAGLHDERSRTEDAITDLCFGTVQRLVTRLMHRASAEQTCKFIDSLL